MVGRQWPPSGALELGVPLLAVLRSRQQAIRGFSGETSPDGIRGGDPFAPIMSDYVRRPVWRGGRQISSHPSPVKADTIFQGRGFSWAKVALQSLQASTPLLYEAHRRNIASI